MLANPITGFRLPKTMLVTVDAFCAKQDLTRSQVFRRSVMDYLKKQNAIASDVNSRESQPAWPEELFGHKH
jgi:metal-responsive CopG/Arc/MetJ family transcriptional regulator